MYNVYPYKMSTGKSGLYFSFKPENASFKAKIEELSGENIDLCFQCGGCSSGCPLTDEMDLLPSTVIRYAQLGMEEVLESNTPWVCVTCFNCEVRCPRGIDIANVMEAVRQTMLRSKYDRFSLDDLTPEELRELPQIAIISNQRKLSA
jgi:heterodisulfide reductase subunit C